MLPFACVNRSISRTIESCQEGRQTSLQDLFGCLSLRAPPAPIQFLVVVQANLHREGRNVIRDWRGVDFTDSCFCIFYVCGKQVTLPEPFNFPNKRSAAALERLRHDLCPLVCITRKNMVRNFDAHATQASSGSDLRIWWRCDAHLAAHSSRTAAAASRRSSAGAAMAAFQWRLMGRTRIWPG